MAKNENIYTKPLVKSKKEVRELRKVYSDQPPCAYAEPGHAWVPGKFPGEWILVKI